MTNPYRPISEFYKQKFGQKVIKVPVSIVDDCPNRRGLKGMQTCVFCDVWGSAARSEAIGMDLNAQIEKYRTKLGADYKAQAFLIYFQAYTNTFTKLEHLKNSFELALTYPDVKGIVVGTRPDCLSKGVLNTWQETHEKSFVAVELGVQAFFDDQLDFLKRGHTAKQSIDAIHRIRRETSVDLGIHLMFGQPTETLHSIVETAKICNDLPISNVKLHNLHVLKNTGLAEQFARGEFAPIELEPYAERVALFLDHLRPDIFIHRLAAYASRWDELIAPAWTAHRMGTHQKILQELAARQCQQGRFFWQTTGPLPCS